LLHANPQWVASWSGRRRGPDTMEDMPHAEVPLKVLVVDDQADSADAVAFMLSLMGHDVHTAYGPREALELFRELQPSVVFMDISMPELSGLEAAARIRSLPEGTSTTIIALTGLGHEQDRRRSREASIDHHVVKPASPAVLHRLLSAIHPEPRASGVGVGVGT
jgi:CheY-like chemotaxis protein